MPAACRHRIRCNLKPGINGDAVEVLKLAACRQVA
jgi:hypothetical protein